MRTDPLAILAATHLADRRSEAARRRLVAPLLAERRRARWAALGQLVSPTAPTPAPTTCCA
jgi:hypothetical protein